MRIFHDRNYWAIILGASSGMGLATAKKLAKAGMNLALIHRDRRSVLEKVNEEFDAIKQLGIEVLIYNEDALNEEKRGVIIDELVGNVGTKSVRLLLHSISKGNLKPIAQSNIIERPEAQSELENKFQSAQSAMDEIQYPNAKLGELDFTLTAQAMATSLVSWVNDLHEKEMFQESARVIGLTSEGDKRIWKGYAAVGAAKATLEVIAKHLAVEMASTGLTANIIQAGITKTPSLQLIPGSDQMMASAKYRNPKGRLTTPEDVANVVYLMVQDEANWINGARIIVDGGEHLV